MASGFESHCVMDNLWARHSLVQPEVLEQLVAYISSEPKEDEDEDEAEQEKQKRYATAPN